MIKIVETKGKWGSDIAELHIHGQFVFKATRVDETWIAMYKGISAIGDTAKLALCRLFYLLLK